jgi:2-keto-4-pentenoate hydratase
MTSAMPSPELQSIAKALIAARLERRQIHPPLPVHSEEDAYAVQDIVASRLGGAIGWKVGAKGIFERPTCAPLLAGLVKANPATFPADQFHMIGIEAEIAFRLRRDFPRCEHPYTEHEVMGAVESIHPAIEVVDTRLAHWQEAGRFALLADNQMNARLVHGLGVTWSPTLELPRRTVRLRVDGRMVVDRVGGNPAGDPCRLLVWLVNHCARHRGGCRTGMVVTTGSWTGLIFVEAGAEVVGEFESIGTVNVSFPAAR